MTAMRYTDEAEIESTEGDSPDRGYRRLVASVLLQAVRDYKTATSGPVATNSTHGFSVPRLHSWFVSTSMEPLAFEWLCAVLDTDPDRVRLSLGVGATPPPYKPYKPVPRGPRGPYKPRQSKVTENEGQPAEEKV